MRGGDAVGKEYSEAVRQCFERNHRNRPSDPGNTSKNRANGKKMELSQILYPADMVGRSILKSRDFRQRSITGKRVYYWQES